MKTYTALAIALVAFATGAQAQILLTTPTGSYLENFNTFTGTAGTIPAGWTAGFSIAPNYVGTGTGTGNTGGLISYGSGADFSFGALRSGTPGDITLGVSFTNNTGLTINTLTISWDYEQDRFQNASGFDLSGTGALAGNSTLDGKDFVGSASGTNGTVAVTGISSFTLTGLNIAAGSSFGFAWLTTDDTGSDNGVAIDNFSLSYTTVAPVPEPATGALLLGGIGAALLFRRRRLS